MYPNSCFLRFLNKLMRFPQELQNPHQGQQAAPPLPPDIPNLTTNYQHDMLYYSQHQLQNQPTLSQAHLNQYLDTTRYIDTNTTSTSTDHNSNNSSISSGENKNNSPSNIPKNDMVSLNNIIKETGNSFVSGSLMNNPLLSKDNQAILSHINLNQLPANPDSVHGSDQIPQLSISQINSTTSRESKNTNNNCDSNGPKNSNITHINNNNTASTALNISNSTLSHLHSGNHDKINTCNNSNTSNSSNASNISSTNTNLDSSNLSTTTTIPNGELVKPPQMNNPEIKKEYNMREILQHTKSTYYNLMNNNPHVINDPSIQESLSPYFHPFGVDVSHLPMTNPPIFQTSLPLYDEPVGRRRISISNGQISQLGEDIETVENLYNTQPPPMPSKGSISSSHPVIDDTIRKQQISVQVTRAIHKDMLKSSPSNITPSNELSHPSTQAQPPVQIQSGPQQEGWSQNASPGNFVHPNTMQSQYALLFGQEQSIPPHNQLNDVNPMTNPSLMVHQQLPLSFNQQNLPLQTQPHINQQHATLSQNNISNMVNNSINSNTKTMTPSPYMKQETSSPNTIPDNSIGKSSPPNDVKFPGTEAWKRARLLEKNRIAASKCRQRKKIAQLQLQKDFDNLSRENIVIKKKLKYYEKLITKFRKFTESHFQNCHKSDGLNDLKMIEDMLMIDQDIHELDDNNSVIGLTDPSYMK